MFSGGTWAGISSGEENSFPFPSLPPPLFSTCLPPFPTFHTGRALSGSLSNSAYAAAFLGETSIHLPCLWRTPTLGVLGGYLYLCLYVLCLCFAMPGFFPPRKAGAGGKEHGNGLVPSRRLSKEAGLCGKERKGKYKNLRQDSMREREGKTQLKKQHCRHPSSSSPPSSVLLLLSCPPPASPLSCSLCSILCSIPLYILSISLSSSVLHLSSISLELAWVFVVALSVRGMCTYWTACLLARSEPYRRHTLHVFFIMAAYTRRGHFCAAHSL